MALNILRLYKICDDSKLLLKHLQEWTLIPKEGEYKCVKCNGFLTLCTDSSRY